MMSQEEAEALIYEINRTLGWTALAEVSAGVGSDNWRVKILHQSFPRIEANLFPWLVISNREEWEHTKNKWSS